MIDKLRRSVRERGVGGTLGRLAGAATEGYVNEELIVLLKDLDQIARPKVLGRLRVEDFDPSQVPALYAMNRERGESDADGYFDRSVRNGFHGFAAFVDDRMVGYYWWVDRDNPVAHPDLFRLGRGFELAAGDVYGASFFLLEEFRGGGRAGEFLYRVESALRDRGYSRLWGYVDRDNRPARWLYTTRGYRSTWMVYNRRFAFLRWRKSVPIADRD
jgi:GNAT superfamily N-acetyltransferase